MAEKQYSIGRFSKLLGVSSDTVRYYEKQGIVRTRRTCNNYRYFTDTDCRGLMMSRMLRSLGFPLKEVCTMLKEGGLPRYVTGMERNVREVEQEIERLKALQAQMEVYREAGKRALEGGDTCELVRCPFAAYFFQQTEEAVLIEQGGREWVSTVLMEQMPLAYQVGILPLSALLGEGEEGSRCGLMIAPEHLPKELCGQMDGFFSWDICARAIISGPFSEEGRGHVRLLRPLLRFIQEQGYAPAGDGVGRLLPIEYGERARWYIQYSIPVKKTE